MLEKIAVFLAADFLENSSENFVIGVAVIEFGARLKIEGSVLEECVLLVPGVGACGPRAKFFEAGEVRDPRGVAKKVGKGDLFPCLRGVCYAGISICTDTRRVLPTRFTPIRRLSSLIASS